MNIEEAKNFVVNTVISPALQSPAISENTKNKIRRSLQIVNAFHRIGDLYLYLSKFTNESDEVYAELTRAQLQSFETIKNEYRNRYSAYLEEVTTINSFIVGRQYSAWDISFCAKTYDVQSGMYLNRTEAQIDAVLIKATFENGKYPNTWISRGFTLKYYFYSRDDKFVKNDGSNYIYNQAILNNPAIPILVFSKLDSNTYQYEGIFRYGSHDKNADGSQFFILCKRFDIDEIYTPETAERLASGLSANHSGSHPRRITVAVEQYVRDAQVVNGTLSRARGICEKCKKPAPFNRERDSSPFLEVHHLTPLSQGGGDHLRNTVALCPNCHRELHHGLNTRAQTQALREWLNAIYN